MTSPNCDVQSHNSIIWIISSWENLKILFGPQDRPLKSLVNQSAYQYGLHDEKRRQNQKVRQKIFCGVASSHATLPYVIKIEPLDCYVTNKVASIWLHFTSFKLYAVPPSILFFYFYFFVAVCGCNTPSLGFCFATFKSSCRLTIAYSNLWSPEHFLNPFILSVVCKVFPKWEPIGPLRSLLKSHYLRLKKKTVLSYYLLLC